MSPLDSMASGIGLSRAPGESDGMLMDRILRVLGWHDAHRPRWECPPVGVAWEGRWRGYA